MGELGVRRRHVRLALARFAAKPARLRLRSSSPLDLLRELDSLHLRIDGKLDIWNALRSSVGPRVGGIDVDEQIRRTERQAEELERRRLAVAATALTYRDGSAALRMRRRSISGVPSMIGGVEPAGE